jgi:hypothetical protein
LGEKKDFWEIFWGKKDFREIYEIVFGRFLGFLVDIWNFRGDLWDVRNFFDF